MNAPVSLSPKAVPIAAPTSSAPNRPALRYHGGKWRLAPWIIAHFPRHRVYVEPFGGGAGVLLRKPRAYAEIYNDLDGDVVQLFETLRDPVQAAALIRLVSLTPYARAEFELSYQPTEEPDRKVIDVMVCRLRPKLKPYDVEILTVQGQGYAIPNPRKRELRLAARLVSMPPWEHPPLPALQPRTVARLAAQDGLAIA